MPVKYDLLVSSYEKKYTGTSSCLVYNSFRSFGEGVYLHELEL